MRRVPSEFLENFAARQDSYGKALHEIVSILRLRIGQLSARGGTRAMISDFRVKRPRKVWKNASIAGLGIDEALTKTEDLLGVRIVCHTRSDIKPLVKMIRNSCQPLDVVEVEKKVSPEGYRATHVRTQYTDGSVVGKDGVPCEIQIRTLAQDAWARLSRADLYGKNVPRSIRRLSQALATQLSAIDEISQLIRDEVNRCPKAADQMRNSDSISPQRLALLYKTKFGEEIWKWTLVGWVQALDEGEVESIGEVSGLLDDVKLRKTLDARCKRIRGFALEDREWVVYSALVAGAISRLAGIRAVEQHVKEEWEEIVATARRDILSGMPETLDGFVKMLESGDAPMDALAEIGAARKCCRCGEDIISPTTASEAVLDYYKATDSDVDLETLFAQSPNAASVDFDDACQYCGWQMSKDD